MILTGIDSGDVSHPSLACDADSGIHIVWYDASSGNPDVYYLRGLMQGVSAVKSRPSSFVSRTYVNATIVRGALVLGAVDSRQKTAYSAAPSDGGRSGQLLDISGRKVMNLRTGANDVRALAPGVYFVREQPQAAGFKPQAVHKVVITR